MTTRQRRFVAEYIANGGNGTQAAIAAGYSKRSAHDIASENLRKPEIAAALAKQELRVTTRAAVTAEMLAAKIWSWVVEGGRDRVAAAALLARMYPEFSEKVERVNPTEIEELARRYGLDPREVMAEAEAIVRDGTRS